MLLSIPRQYRPLLGGVLVGFFVLGGLILVSDNLQKSKQDEIKLIPAGGAEEGLEPGSKEVLEPGSGGVIKAHIAGAVTSPGVFELAVGSRVEDLVAVAGGFNDEVDGEWVAKNINLATKLADEDKVYIPSQGEFQTTGVVTGIKTETPSSVGGAVNINTANAAQLDSLPGIGPAYAQRIIDYREANGGFKSVDELTNISGIGAKTVEKLRGLVSVN